MVFQEKSQRCKSVLKVRAKVLDLTRDWLNNEGFIEVQGPIITPSMGESRNSFRLNYFGHDSYLAGGLHPYSDAFLQMFDKIFTVSPGFRADELETNRHLAEYWRIEVAVTKQHFETIIELQEKMISHICSNLEEIATDELRLLVGNFDSLKLVEAPFPRLTYDRAIKLLQEMGNPVVWGEKISWELENKLSKSFDRPFFLTEFPVSGETFFLQAISKKPYVTLSADLLAPQGYGEIASSGQVITEKKLIIERLKGINVKSADRKWYLGLRNFDSVPQCGFALGLERLLLWLCRLDSVREASVFPRSFKYPYV